MGWTFTIGEGADAVVIDELARFGFKTQKNLNSNDEVESVEWIFNIQGTAKGTPAVIKARIDELNNQVVEEFNGVRLLIQHDGVTWQDLLPVDGFLGPQVTDFETLGEEEGGAGLDQWKYRMTVVYRSRGLQEGGDNADVYELQTSVSKTTKNGKVIRKVWKASAKSRTSAAALAAVLGFKPSDKYITHEQEEFPEDARATSVWVWEHETGAVLGWDCRVTYRGGRNGWVAVPQAGAQADPIAFPKQRGFLTVEVEGEIRSFEPEISPPSAHFSESDTLVRDTENERTQEPAIFDRHRGEYVLRYHEVYQSFGPLQVGANHDEAHNVIPDGEAPAD